MSRDVAASNFSMTSGAVSLSATVSHIDPVHAPCAPIAIAAAIWLPRPMPPAASTAVSGPTASITSGQSTTDEISPVCPPASVPWATMMSTPFSLCFRAWRGVLASAATAMPWSCAVWTTSAGGGPSAFTSSDTGCSSATSICARPVVSVQPSRWCGFASSGSGEMSCSASTFSTKSRWPCGIIASSWRSSSEGSLSAPRASSSSVAGITRSTPYGRPSTCSSIHRSSTSSSSGVK